MYVYVSNRRVDWVSTRGGEVYSDIFIYIYTLIFSNHQLEIETGQYKKFWIDQILCKICNENFWVEDDFHF